MSRPFFCLLLLALAELHRAIAWDYKLNGGDWSGQGMCGKGGQQSPIDLPMAAPTAKEELTMFLKYPKLTTAVTIYNTGKSLALTLPDSFRSGFGVGKGSEGAEKFATSEDADAYRLWQVNFHAPSEHTINGVQFPLEMQMMHQQATGGGGMAVVVVLFDAAPNAYGTFLDSILGKSMPKKAWDEVIRQPPIEFAPLLAGAPYYTYEGSLTSPPCEQQVKYFVKQDPVPAAHAQLLQFSEILQAVSGPKGNFRAVQPTQSKVENRPVLLSSVDLVGSPNDMTKPKKAKLKELKVKRRPPASCNSTFIDDAFANVDRLATTDRPALAKAKIEYNQAFRDQQQVEAAISANERQVKMLKGFYENTPGPVEKIDVAWKLDAAKKLLEGGAASMPEKEKELKKAKGALIKQILLDCIPKVPEKAEPTPAPKVVKAEKKKATRHFTYPEPHVKLPHGLGGSPFTEKPLVVKSEAVIADKIAANLQQAEVPQGAEINEAKGKEFGVMEDKKTEYTLKASLPISEDSIVDKETFKKDFVKALADSAGIEASTMVVKELAVGKVAKVHKTTMEFLQPSTRFLQSAGLHQ